MKLRHETHAVRIVHCLPRLNAKQHIVCFVIGSLYIVSIVSDNEGYAELFMQTHQRFVHLSLLR